MSWTTDVIKVRYKEMEDIAATDVSCLCDEPLVSLSSNESGGYGRLTIFLSERLIRLAKKERLNRSPKLWKTLQNLRYGYDPRASLSPGGKDGIFAVRSDFKPKNEMVRKLYDRYRETERGKEELRTYLRNPMSAQGVRVVSHDLRLLGFIEEEPGESNGFRLVLVSLDVNKH